ncbi:MAG TPA: hypothetical protein VM120_07135 [Bryobacteraceae bacterium]|nr:hypothetical protein [Bryobacteraceae bacterium]
MKKRIAKPQTAHAAEQSTPPPEPANPQPEERDWAYKMNLANLSFIDAEIANASPQLGWLLREVFAYMKVRKIEADVDGFRKAFATILQELENDYCNYATWLDAEQEELLYDSKN